MKIIPLSEGAFTVDKTKQFVPFDLQKDNIAQRPGGSLLVEIQPFVIITSKDIMLLDSGLGFKNSEDILQIHTNLLDHGINPSEITKVLLSHLHKDHAGGITKKENGQAGLLSFTKADYYINKQEFTFAFEKGAPSYDMRDLAVLKDSPQLKFTEGNGEIDDYIRYETTGAHCPFHQVFWVIEEGEKIFFGGDVAPQLLQMKTKFVAKYDYDGKRSMELRKQWWQLGKEEKWIFLFYHDIKCPIYGY
jgi:glyoxylase-like metal-dependent hydrolase (beta-lactamase superfamily II)